MRIQPYEVWSLAMLLLSAVALHVQLVTVPNWRLSEAVN